jgi:restriction modification system DNA specificity domain protein
MGKTSYNVVLEQRVAGIKGNEFIYQCLVEMDSDGYWKKLATGSTFEAINSDGVNGAELMVPQDIAEQDRIGEYFTNLDNLITLHQCELKRK